MSLQYQIGINDQSVQKAFTNLINAGSDFTELMDLIGPVVVDSAIDNFESESAPDGTPWAPTKKNVGQILTNKGYLRRSIHYVPSRDQVWVGSKLPYAAIHQFGGRAGRKHASLIPARPYFGFNDAMIAEVKDLVGNHISSAVEGLK